MGSKVANDTMKQYKLEKKRFKKRMEEKPLDFRKQKELVKKGIQKTLT